MGVDCNSFFPEEEVTQEVLIVSVLSLLALVSRAYGIWEWPITGDEYFTIANVEERATGIVGSAYYILVWLSQTIFGEAKWTARLPAVVLGVLSVPSFYVMCKAMFNRRVATIGCVFIVLSEWHIYHSQIARFYSGVFVFGAVSYYLYYISIKKEYYSYAILSILSSLIAVSFHATSVFVVVSCGVHALFIITYPHREEVGLSRNVAKLYLLLCVVGGIVAIPKFLAIAGEWGGAYGGLTADVLSTMLGVVENIGVPIAVSAFFGLLYLYFVNYDKSYMLFIFTAIPVVSVLVFSIFLPPARPRYLFYSLPLFFALSSFFCVSVGVEVRRIMGAGVGVAIVISSVIAVSFLSYYSGRLSLDVRDPTSFVEEKYESGDNVVVFGWSIQNQLDREMDVNLIKSKSFWQDQLVPIAEEEGRTWVIIDTYRTAPVRRDLEAWLMENASLKWRKEETRFDYTQRGYEVWVEGAD